MLLIATFVTFSMFGRKLDSVNGFVGCLVVLDDVLDGLFTVPVTFFNHAVSVLDPLLVALCTVWNVERRVV